MVEPGSSEIEAALDTWLAPFLEVIGRKTRRRWAPLYLHGLLGPDGRKSLQPLAARLGLGGHDQLQHFIASPAWDDAPLRAVLAGKADTVRSFDQQSPCHLSQEDRRRHRRGWSPVEATPLPSTSPGAQTGNPN